MPDGAHVVPGAQVTRPRLPRELYELSALRSSGFVLYALVAFVGCGLAASWVVTADLPWLLRAALIVPLVVMAGHGLHLAGFVGHEGTHLLLARRKEVSVLVGAFVSAMALFSAVGYGISHWNHHRFTNQSSDPDSQLYPRLRTLWSRSLLSRTLAQRNYLRNTLMAALGKPLPFGYKLPLDRRTQRRLAQWNLAFWAFWLTLYVGVTVAFPLQAAVGLWLPFALGGVMSGLRIYIEHAATEVGPFRDSRSSTSPFYTMLFCGNNFHLEHHLYPSVPCYRLPAVHRTLAALGCFERWGSLIERGVIGPLKYATQRAQYPEAATWDLADDPFVGRADPPADLRQPVAV